MQLNQNTILPYPCLNVNIEDEDMPSNIDFKITHRNLVETTFKVSAKTTNVEILELIKLGKAKYCLEMDCKNAFYRDALVNTSGEFSVSLINNRFNGKIWCTLSVVAIEDIYNYKNSSFDFFYKSFTINIEAGETIAYLGCFDINMLEKSKDVKNMADDFIEVVLDDSLKYSRFDLGGPKILLKLPKNLYDQYYSPRISQNDVCEPFLHASFLLNVLTSALQNLGTYSKNKWAESLHDRIEREDELRQIASASEDGDVFDDEGALQNPDTALDLAQCILANPYERMFDSFENLNNREDD